MKKILVPVLFVLLLCLALAPALAGSSSIAAYSPTEKISLAPFVHITDSTVTDLTYGIGYVDSVFTIDNGSLTGTYTNTTEINTVPTNILKLGYISFYGSSQVTINNTNMSSTVLCVYGSSQVTLINSSVDWVYAYNSSKVTLTNNSTVWQTISSQEYSEVSILKNASVKWRMSVYGNSKVYFSESKTNQVELYENGYLNASNSTIGYILLLDSSTGTISNSSTINYLTSINAANVSVEDSTITDELRYGIVCTGGSLTIDGNTITNSTPYRNTTTIINSATPAPSLISVCALADSTVTIRNNNGMSSIVAQDSSSVSLENFTLAIGPGCDYTYTILCTDYSNVTFKNSQQTKGIVTAITCEGYSSLTLQNVTNIVNQIYIELWDYSSATIMNTSTTSINLRLVLLEQSTAVVKHLTLGGISNLDAECGDLSILDIVNVTKTDSASITLVSWDLSVMTIYNSSVSEVGCALKSTGDMQVIDDVLSGSYINTTQSYNSTSDNTFLQSIAVVGTHTLTTENSSVPAEYVILHDSGKLNTHNSTLLGYIVMLNSSKVSGNNTKIVGFEMFDRSSISLSNTTIWDIMLFDRSSVSLSNATIDYVWVSGSATMTCSGSETATSTIGTVYVRSYYPNMVNLVIDNCTVGEVVAVTWIPQAAGLGYILPLLFYSSSTQNQVPVFTLLLAGGAIAAVAVAALFLWRRRA